MSNKLKKGDFSEATNEVALFLDWENIKKAIDNDLETFFLNNKEIAQECPEIPSKQFAKILLANNILNRHYRTGLDAKTGKTFPITTFTLNQFDSRVQVYLGMSG